MKNIRQNGETLHQIGAVARQLQINVRTLRFYESIGLVEPAARSASGYRLYDEADVERLRFVLRAKRVGFTLDEIGQVLRMPRKCACGFVRATLKTHIEETDAKIAALQRQSAQFRAVRDAWQDADVTQSGPFCALLSGSWQATSPREVISMKNSKRQVEVFTAGCPLCDPVVEMVQRLACDACEVTIHDLRQQTGEQRAREAGVVRAPMVLVNGQPAACCESGPVTEAGLRAAGVGAA